MRQAAFWHRTGVGAALAVFVALSWTSASMAAPGAQHCRMARGWVQDNCGSAAGREGTPGRCMQARAWVNENCPARMEVASTHPLGSELDDEDEEVAEVPRPRRVHKSRRRAVHAPAKRSHRHAQRADRAPRYKDKVFVSDYRRIRGHVSAIYAMLDKDKF